MVIREWRESDRGALTVLAQTALDDHARNAILDALRVPAAFSAFDADRTLVAVDGGNLVGIGALWENDIHPARWRVNLHGRSTFWTQGAAASLLSRLQELRPDPRRLQTAISARNEPGCAFFPEHGFALRMRTRSGILPPGSIPEAVAQDFDAASNQTSEAGIKVVPLAAFRNRPFSYVQLARLHADIYTQAHTWDPVRELTGGEPAELFLDSEELLLDATYVALQKKRLVGVSSLRGAGIPGQVELGWTGAVLDDEQQRKPLVQALLGESLRHATSENWPVAFEVDEADTILWDMTARLPLDLEPDWLTFVETGPDPGGA